ncbi:MAG TPA: hypothetical protein PKN04_01540 [bacterium]|jgi:hypothetical protein|nr:hypothetical protein [bacterium]HNT64442.1 hypothetical protein [bacterium]HOX84711.1 hypothetical protein [bacterium]HPG45434.1 hypothetical protein [bacterium]HPM96790.1 hypothetical protein [bacterium]
MQFIEINETIEVISYFDGRTMRPLRFRWRGRPYRVDHINGIWHDVKGQNRDYHFHISAREAGSFELIYQTAALQWKLGRVCVDGD